MKQIIWVVLVWLQVLHVQAANVSTEQAQNFLHYSGLNNLIEELPAMFQQQFNMESLAGNDPAKTLEMQRALSAAISRIQGNGLALGYLTKEADGSLIQQVLEFLESPLGKRVVDAENGANTPEGQKALHGYASQLLENPPSPERARLLDNLSAALKVDELMMAMMQNIFFSTLKVGREVKPDMAAEMEKFMSTQWEQMQSMMRVQLMQMATASVYYTYRDLSDQDLQDYTVYMQSTSGQAYLKLGMDIMNRYVSEVTSVLIQQLLAGKQS